MCKRKYARRQTVKSKGTPVSPGISSYKVLFALSSDTLICFLESK
jgi:hypothetical protein